MVNLNQITDPGSAKKQTYGGRVLTEEEKALFDEQLLVKDSKLTVEGGEIDINRDFDLAKVKELAKFLDILIQAERLTSFTNSAPGLLSDLILQKHLFSVPYNIVYSEDEERIEAAIDNVKKQITSSQRFALAVRKLEQKMVITDDSLKNESEKVESSRKAIKEAQEPLREYKKFKQKVKKKINLLEDFKIALTGGDERIQGVDNSDMEEMFNRSVEICQQKNLLFEVGKIDEEKDEELLFLKENEEYNDPLKKKYLSKGLIRSLCLQLLECLRKIDSEKLIEAIKDNIEADVTEVIEFYRDSLSFTWVWDDGFKSGISPHACGDRYINEDQKRKASSIVLRRKNNIWPFPKVDPACSLVQFFRFMKTVFPYETLSENAIIKKHQDFFLQKKHEINFSILFLDAREDGDGGEGYTTAGYKEVMGMRRSAIRDFSSLVSPPNCSPLNLLQIFKLYYKFTANVQEVSGKGISWNKDIGGFYEVATQHAISTVSWVEKIREREGFSDEKIISDSLLANIYGELKLSWFTGRITEEKLNIKTVETEREGSIVKPFSENLTGIDVLKTGVYKIDIYASEEEKWKRYYSVDPVEDEILLYEAQIATKKAEVKWDEKILELDKLAVQEAEARANVEKLQLEKVAEALTLQDLFKWLKVQEAQENREAAQKLLQDTKNSIMNSCFTRSKADNFKASDYTMLELLRIKKNIDQLEITLRDRFDNAPLDQKYVEIRKTITYHVEEMVKNPNAEINVFRDLGSNNVARIEALEEFKVKNVDHFIKSLEDKKRAFVLAPDEKEFLRVLKKVKAGDTNWKDEEDDGDPTKVSVHYLRRLFFSAEEINSEHPPRLNQTTVQRWTEFMNNPLNTKMRNREELANALQTIHQDNDDVFTQFITNFVPDADPAQLATYLNSKLPLTVLSDLITASLRAGALEQNDLVAEMKVYEQNNQVLDLDQYGGENVTEPGVAKYVWEKLSGARFSTKPKVEEEEERGGPSVPPTRTWGELLKAYWYIPASLVVVIVGLVVIYWRKLRDWWENPISEDSEKG